MDPIKDIFELVKSKKLFVDENDFRSQINSNPKDVYSAISDSKLFVDYGDFENQLGFKKKEPTIPSAPSSQPAPISGLPETKKPPVVKQPDFSGWESAIYANKIEAERTSAVGYVAGPGAIPYLPSDAQINSIKAERQKAQAKLKSFESQNAPEVEKITDNLTSGEKWKGFITQDAADVSKLLSVASDESKKRGGGDGVREIIYNSLLNKVEYNKIKPDVQKRYEEKVKKETGKTADEYIKDIMSFTIKTDPDIAKKVQEIQALKINYDNKIKSDQESTNARLKQKGENLFNQEFLPQLEEKAKSLGLTRSTEDPSKWVIPYDEGTPQYESAKKQWASLVDKTNAMYISRMRTLVAGENQRISRVSSEFNRILTDKVTQLNKGVELPKSEVDKLNSLYAQSYTEVANEKAAAKGVSQDILTSVYGKGWLFNKAIGASLFSTLASKGEMLVSVGLNNGFTDWLRSFKTTAEQMQVISKPLEGKNLFNPDTYLTRVGNTLGSSLTSLASGVVATAVGGPTTGVLVGGLAGFADETASMTGESYSQALSDGYSEEESGDKSRKVGAKNFALLPLYMLQSVALVRQMSGLKGLASGSAIEGIAEVLTEVPQTYFQNVERRGYAKTPMEYLKSEGKLVALDTFIGSLGQSAVISTTFEGINSFKKSISGAERQMFIEALNKKGMSFANAILESQYINGVIDKEELARKKEELRGIADNLGSLDELGLTEDQKKFYSGIKSEIEELRQKSLTTSDETIKSNIEDQIKAKENDAKEILNGRDSYVKVISPLGVEFIATPEQAQQIFENPKNSKLIADDVIGFEFINAEETKSLYEKTKSNAITPSEGIVQEGVPEGGIVQPTRVETQGQEAPTETNVGNRPVGGERKVDVANIETIRSETESKIKKKNLFDGVGVFSTELGGSENESVPVGYQEKNNIELVEYANPKTGVIDIIVTGTSSNDFVGFYRLYENGVATNRWSSKFENQSRNKENFKTMISEAQALLPEGHQYTEKTSISTDGLRVWNQQLSRGYEIVYENGKPVTNLVAINGDAIVNELGIPVDRGQFENIKVTTKEDFEKVKSALLPYMERLGLNESNIHWYTGTVKIDLPVLTKKKEAAPREAAPVSPINIQNIVDRAQQSLSQTGIQIQVVDNEEDAVKFAGEAARGNQGVFVSKEGKIVIDKSKLADAIEAGIVVWHEASHPVMNIIRNTNKALYDKISSGLSSASDKNIDVRNALDWARQQYSDKGAAVVADEAIVEVIGRIGSGVINPETIETGLRQSIIDFINSISKALGFGEILNDTDIATFKKIASQVSDTLKSGRPISEVVGEENVMDYGVPFNEQIQTRVPDKFGEKLVAKDNYSLSFVKPEDLIDIQSLVEEIASKGQKVWFWTADQLGRGQYYDKVINGEHFLDAGPSFALDPKNRERGVIWATGKSESWINKNIQNSDYIFIISGSPLKSKLFNKRVAEITINRIQATADFNKFKSDILSVSKIKDLNNLLNEFNSFDELLDSPKRKDFLNVIDEQKAKKGTPLKAMLEKYNAFIDYNELRDGFYKENGFDLNDVMLVLKPEKFGGKSEHSTYENDILGSVVGVPDRIVNAFDIMTDDVKSKYQELMSRTMQSQAVAPYGAGIREVQASVGGRVELSREFKLASFVMRKKQEGATDAEITSGIASISTLTPAEIQSLVSNPEQWLMDQNPTMTDLQKENLVERAKIQNIYRSRQYGLPTDPAFSGLEVPRDYVDQYLNRNNTRDANLLETLKNFKNKWLDPAQGLPDWILAERDFATGAKNIEINRAMNTIRDLKQEAKNIKFEDWDAFSKAIVASIDVSIYLPDGTFTAPVPPEVSVLPDSIIPYVYKMRSQIDALTKDLVGSGYVTPEQAVTLEKNIGAYVNRAYRMYNETGWKPAKEQITDAVKFLADQYVKEIATDNNGILTFDQIQEEAVEKAKKDIQAILDKKRNPYFNASVESRNTGILKERQDIPEPIRKLMGEYTDPGTVFIMTVAKQAALKASSQYLSKMREFGLGSLFFEKSDPKRPAEFSVEIASPGSETKSPLNGLYTTPEISDVLQTQDPTYNDITNWWMKVVGAVRYGKTVLSPVTQAKNFESNLGFAVMNGLIYSGKSGQAFGGARKYFKGQYTKGEIDSLTEKVIRLNLVNQSVGIGELRSMLGSGDIHDIALDIAVNPDGRWGKKVSKKLNIFGAASKLYRMSDDFWKVYAYLNEREMVSIGRYNNSAYNDLSPEEQEKVDIEASERVKNTWPTYDRVFPIVKKVIKGVPIVGNFPSFSAESLRVLVNTVKMAREDMLDPQMRSHGVRRMLGITTYVMARTAITYAVAQSIGIAASGIFGKLMGDDDEERRKHALKQALPPYMMTADIMAKQNSKEPHKYTIYSLSSADPYGIPYNALNALTDGREGIFGKRMEPGVGAATLEFFSNFLEPEMTFDAAWAIRNNMNPKTGRPIVNDTDTDYDKYEKMFGFLWNQLQPSVVGLAERGVERGFGPELMSGLGMRPVDIDLHKSFSFALSDMASQMELINSDYYKIKKSDKYTQEEKDAAEVDAENRKSYLIQKTNILYKEFIELGANPKELDEIIKKKSSAKPTGFDKNTKKFIKTGVIDPKRLFK